jgi:hypothetical protein
MVLLDKEHVLELLEGEEKDQTWRDVVLSS